MVNCDDLDSKLLHSITGEKYIKYNNKKYMIYDINRLDISKLQHT